MTITKIGYYGLHSSCFPGASGLFVSEKAPQRDRW